MASDEEIRAALAPLLADVRGVLEHDMGRIAPVPDLDDVLSRAHTLAPDLVPEPDVVQPDPAGPVLPLGSARHRSAAGPESPGFASFLGEVRGHVEGLAAERAMGHIPPLRGSRETAGRRLAVTIGAVMAAAAAVLLVTTGILALGRRVAQTDGVAAQQAADRVESTVEERDVAPAPAPAPPARTRAASPTPSPSAAEEDDDILILEEDEPEPPAPPSAQPLTERLARLDAQAQALWRAGDRQGAARKLEELVRIGGRSHRAELAFGDLFTLSYQLSGAGSRTKLWRRYLERFPRGKYADDARAGLCRQRSGDEGLACWERYLADWPRGAHRAEARAAVR